MVNCSVCQKEFEGDRQLHAHIKAHDMRVAEYYQSQFPRYDKYDKNIIKFKNKDQYLSSDFNSRTNLKNWLKSVTIPEAQEYCKEVLLKRKKKKSLVYSPSQVEMRSILIPPVHFYNELFGDYYALCKELGFKNKYQNCTDIVYGSAYNDPSYKIYVDTREKMPLKFKNVPSEIKTLKFGDYAFSDELASCKCYIERKSVSDFIGTLSGGFERFKREIERAKEAEANFVVLVEETLTNCLSFNFLPHVFKKGTRVTPEYVFHNVRALIQEYPFVQFLFVKGRVEAAEAVKKIFTSGCIFKKIDLQLAYDTKVLECGTAQINTEKNSQT
tara:strand:- start:4554 stop:5537 length:984 start_codon:yes stop_codon:yes gene_type:complete